MRSRLASAHPFRKLRAITARLAARFFSVVGYAAARQRAAQLLVQNAKARFFQRIRATCCAVSGRPH